MRHKLYNIGFGAPVKLLQFVECLEEALGIPAIKHFLPLQPGDVVDTWADTRELEEHIGFRPQVAVPVGVQSFVDWYRAYYRV